MKKYISTNLIKVIRNLYNEATSAVLFNSSIGDWFRTTVGLRHGCVLSLTIFNIFLERIMADAVEYHEGTVSNGGKTTTKRKKSVEISAEKTRLMANNTSGINKETKVNGQKL